MVLLNRIIGNKNMSKYILIIANLFPIFAVILLDWNVFEVIFVYYSETLIFLILSFIKVFYLDIPLKSKITSTLTYSLAISIFVAFEGAVILLFYFAEINEKNTGAEISEIFKLIFNSSYFYGLAIFTVSHLYAFVVDFIKKKQYENKTIQEVIKAPFIQIWIILMIAFAGMAISKYADSIYVLIIFILLKTWLSKLTMNRA